MIGVFLLLIRFDFLFICCESKDLFKEYLIVEKMEPEETLEELAERDW